MATLVFKTLRVGFPTAHIKVHLNNGFQLTQEEESNYEICSVSTIHHDWINQLIEKENDPFWICDTDIIFYENVEKWEFGYLAGSRIQEWQDDFSGAVTRSRLHTSLLFIDPVKVREKVNDFARQCPDTPFTPFVNLVNPLCLPFGGRLYFHDTASLLYHAIGGESFTDRQKDSYFHFNFGTIPDLVMPRLEGADQMAEARDKILKNPSLGRGAWRVQEEYYRSKPVRSSKPVAALPDPQREEEARKWNVALTCNNPEAMAFNDLWYNYCHGIDDLLDTAVDGRPSIGNEATLELFANAALLYNHPFFVKNRAFLLPIALSVTNSFADSVAWEKSPFFRRRVMADALRTCGNEMYHAVAMICGGWRHARAMSPLIRDRDWVGQHDQNNNSESISYGSP